MLNYQELLNKEAKKRGWSDEQTSVFEAWRSGVGKVESNNIADRLQGDDEKGIGRGKYQYESTRGSGTNKTALNRLVSLLKIHGYSLKDLPENDRLELEKPDPDFAKLSEGTQDMAFLADKSMAKETKLNDLVEGKINFDDAWINWHWKGQKDQAEAKKEQWAKNVGVMGIQDLFKPFDPTTFSEVEWGIKPYETPVQPPVPKDLQNWQEPSSFEMPQQPEEKQYATMEELLMDRGLMKNPLMA